MIRRIIHAIANIMAKEPAIDQIRDSEIRDVPRCLLVDYLAGTACLYGLDWWMTDAGAVRFMHPAGHGMNIPADAPLREADTACAKVVHDADLFELVWHSNPNGQWAAPKGKPRLAVAYLTREAEGIPGEQWRLTTVAEVSGSFHTTAEGAKARAQEEWTRFVDFIRS
jgi:hypothetical protein